MSNDKGNVAVAVIGTALASAAQFDIEESIRIILLILSLIATIITITFTLYKWYKCVTSQKSDGGKKITADELKDGIKIATDGITEIKDGVTKIGDVVKEDKTHGDKH